VLTTTLTKRAQTTVPAPIRRRHNIQPGDTLAWVDDGETIKVIPLPRDPIRALRGCAQGEGLVQRLLAARQQDR
jgi:AbrB family looped-hinge helix DNA binding protein